MTQKTRSFWITLTIFIATVQAVSIAQSIDQTSSSIVSEETIDSWLMTDRIVSFMELQKKNTPLEKTGLSSNDYLKIIEGQVKAFQKYQNESGRIIDPVTQHEMHYSTPCYAHSVAVLAASGYTTNKKLIASGVLAMDAVTADMAKNISPEYAPNQAHGDFFTYPTLFALKLFKGVVAEDKYNSWRERIGAMDPKKYYAAYDKNDTNWNLVNTAGEFMRFTEGFTTMDYVNKCLEGQLPNFTDYGMYSEHGNPFAYDAFSRYFVTGMLAQGYDGSSSEEYKKILWKGAWMSMFIQSPFGEMPTGYRSSNHIWGEAEQCVVFEAYATDYAKKGQLEIAGAFRRAAMLSLKSISSWIREDGSGYVVKNKYPIKMKHGYQGYSEHSCYNLLSTSMLAQAWQFSKELEIKEKAAPADLGGFVVSVHEPFHKIIASVGGNYMEYDTKGDELYSPTGIVRMHLKGTSPQLGPSDAIAGKFAGIGAFYATGPTWRSSGKWAWISLAKSKSEEDPVIEILKETGKEVKFRVTHQVKDKAENLIGVIETITLDKGGIIIENELIGDIDAFRFTWPALLYNGETFSEIEVGKKHAIIELDGNKIKLEAISPSDVTFYRSFNQYNHPNGIMEPMYIAAEGNKVTFKISVPE